MTNDAPTEAACGAPNSAGSASGLRSRPCSAAPAKPNVAADQDRQQRARQPDIAHDDAGRAVAAEQPRQRLARRQAGRADHQRDDGEHDDQRRQRQIEPKAAWSGARHHQSSGAFPTGFRLALQRNCGTIVRAGGTMLSDLTGRILATNFGGAGGARARLFDGGRRRAAPAHRVVQRLRRPAGDRARRSRPDRRAVAQCARSRDLGGGREGGELSAARLDGRGHGAAQARPGAGRPLGPAADAADAARPRIPDRRRSARQRPGDRDRADPRHREAASGIRSAARR